MRTCFKYSLIIFLFLISANSLWAGNLSDDQGGQTHPAGVEDVRFGFDRTILGAVNENDARAIIHAWTHSMFQERNIQARAVIHIFDDVNRIEAELEKKQLDVVCLTTVQWVSARRFLAEDSLLAVKTEGGSRYEFVVIAHKNSQVKGIRDLKEKRLMIWAHSRTCLSPYWLGALMAEKGLDPPETYFKSIVPVPKINKAVLSVFFRQADACMVTFKGFTIMSELNPQLARQMKIVEKSEPYISVLFGFRKYYKSKVQQLMLDDFQSLVDSPAGAQLLTIFQMEGMERITMADLENVLLLLKSPAKL